MQAKQRINESIRVRTADLACHFVNILHRTKTWRKIAIQERVQATLGITMQRQGDLLKVLERNVLEQFFQHDNHVIKGFTVQQCLDVALIALHNEFHFGPKMTARFESAFLDTFMAYAQMCVDDAADDPEIVYTKEKMDRALRAACGENIRPFEERYAIENLYFREKLKEKR